MPHKKRFDEITKKENVAKRMDEAIAAIRGAYTDDAANAYVESKIAAMQADDQKKNEMRSKVKSFIGAMSQNANAEMFKRQIVATMGEEKLKTADEEAVLKTIAEIEADAVAKKAEVMDKYFNMLIELSKTMEKPEGDVVEKLNKKAETGGQAQQAAEGGDVDIDIESLRRELLKQKEMTTDYLNSLQRMKADFDNYKKRIVREKEEYKSIAMESFMNEILPVLDCFDEIKPDSKIDFEGIQKIKKLLLTAASKYSLSEIDTATVFDPNLHQALTTEERDDFEDGTIIETFRKGYKLGEKVLRPSLTKVSVKKDAPPVENGGAA